MMKKSFILWAFFATLMASAQTSKPKSYIITKEESYTIEVKSNKPSIVAQAVEKKWVGDKDDGFVTSNRISYASSFEDVTDIEAFSISPAKKKEKVKQVYTEDLEIEDIFYHDMKSKYYHFYNLEEGSETFSSYRKEYRVPQLLDAFYFKDGLDCRSAKLELKVGKNVEIGYILRGTETDKIQFSTQPDGDYTRYTWQLENSERDELFADAPKRSYYSPHLIFYIKNYKTDSGVQDVVGSVENLYKYYYRTVKDINKTDQSALKNFTADLIKGKTGDLEKTRAIFEFVQTKINYVAFEDGMGGYVPREASEVFQKRYGDCKDMANLINEMLKIAGVESYLAWIGTRHNNYRYEDVPTPLVDNHMIAVARINGKYIFLDGTGQYTLFPGFTAFIQGKQALLKISEQEHKIVPVPVIPAQENATVGKMSIAFEGSKLTGKADFNLSGYTKSQFNGVYKTSANRSEMLKGYLARFIGSITTSGIQISHDDLSNDPLAIAYDFSIEKWAKEAGDDLIFKPALFFPYSDSRIDIEKRKVPVSFDFNKSFDFEYAIEIPSGYKADFIPENFSLKNDMLEADMTYSVKDNTITVRQRMATNTLLLQTAQFEAWNTAIKNITKQYNQNIILTKA